MAAHDEPLEHRIGEHFVVGFHGYELSADITTLVRDFAVGNAILFKRNVQSIEQVRRLTAALQQVAREAGHERPLLIGIDQENGLVSAFNNPSGNAGTQFPGAMALAASESTVLTEKVFAASAAELHLAGINWVYAPVADVNSDPRNPVIGVRSFGDDPEKVGEHACAAARGISSAGLAACAKHFPGHGDTHVDSHLSLPIICKTGAELAETELVPFRALAAARVPSIMTAHIALPNFTGTDGDADIPASLSRAITTDLLRGELAYDGVVVSDCLEMDAIAAGFGTEQGAVRALRAGADIAMVCHRADRQRGAVEAAQAALRDGTLSLDELRVSAARIARLKDRFAGTWADVLDGSIATTRLAEAKQTSARLSAEAYALSTALVQDPGHALPLPASRSVVLLTPRMEALNAAVDDPEGLVRRTDGSLRNTAGPAYLSFAASVGRRLKAEDATVHHVVYSPSAEELEGAVDELLGRPGPLPAIVFATRNADRSAWQTHALRTVLLKADAAARRAMERPSVVVVATCTPYDLYGPGALGLTQVPFAYVATFEFTGAALEAAAAVLFGERKATGRVPVLGGNVVRHGELLR